MAYVNAENGEKPAEEEKKAEETEKTAVAGEQRLPVFCHKNY